MFNIILHQEMKFPYAYIQYDFFLKNYVKAIIINLLKMIS